MPAARIIDETGRQGLWTDALKEVLASSGFGVADPADDSAGLTVLLYSSGNSGKEDSYQGDLLVLSVPQANVSDSSEPSRTEIMGSSRLKARHQLTDLAVSSALADEIRPLVKLFVH